MPFYVQQGNIPAKRHIQHRDHNGNLYYEELVSRQGFSDIYSNVYHIHPPTRVQRMGAFEPIELIPTADKTHRHHHVETFKLSVGGDWISARKPLFFNSDVVLGTASPTKNGSYIYRNGHADEMIYIQRGAGHLISLYGKMSFREGDYIVIPKGIPYQLNFTSDTGNQFFWVESAGPIETPERYRNQHGQHLEHSPFMERDFRTPELEAPVDETGEFEIKVKLVNGYQTIFQANHPFDLIGWDGYYYPWILNIHDFMPIVGKIHQPPPVHQTFQAPGFVVCSFVPRLFDWHELSIPAPYAHSNVDSDEIIYYSRGNFMSRSGIGEGSITLHPAGLPHGPQPGKYEASIGKQETNELAVMVDTFKPLQLTEFAMQIDDANYPLSWIQDKQNDH